MLTGESIPVVKSEIPNDDHDIFDPSSSKHSKYTLYGGTEVTKTKSQNSPIIYGMIFQTGFSTTKGALVRSIMYPKPLNFKFYRDSYFFIGALFITALIGSLIGLYFFIKIGLDWFDLTLNFFDIYTVAIPPALPISLTVGIVFAVDRLKKQKISCVAPERFLYFYFFIINCYN